MRFLRYNSRALVHDKVGRHAEAIADFDEVSAAAVACCRLGICGSCTLRASCSVARNVVVVVGTAYVGTAQVGAAQAGTAQAGTAQVGTAQAGTA